MQFYSQLSVLKQQWNPVFYCYLSKKIYDMMNRWHKNNQECISVWISFNMYDWVSSICQTFVTHITKDLIIIDITVLQTRRDNTTNSLRFQTAWRNAGTRVCCLTHIAGVTINAILGTRGSKPGELHDGKDYLSSWVKIYCRQVIE